MVREYPKSYAKDFLNKAKRFLEIAMENKERYPKESAFNAIQSIINANDALTISIIGKRASIDHREAISLHKEVTRKTGDSSKLSVLQKGIELRDATGYDVKKFIGKKDCELLIKRAQRFVDWVDNLIK